MSVPYIGSKISLISRSEIRYEGTLYTIDTKEATVALQGVRSFGTEGRARDGPQLLPSNDVYDYVIFRGSDIKDLHVCEAPPPMPSSLPQDPAIVSVTPHLSVPISSSPQTDSVPPQSPSEGSAAAAAVPTSPESAKPHQPLPLPTPQLVNPGLLPQPEVPLPHPPSHRGGHAGTHPRANPITSAAVVKTMPEFDFVAHNAEFDKKHFVEELRVGWVSKTERPSPSGGEKKSGEEDDATAATTTTNTNTTNTTINTTATTTTTEASSPTDTGAEEIEPKYNPKKSFFDNISCTSVKRIDPSSLPAGGHRHQDERRRNVETFGEVSARGFGRGRRGGRRNYGRGGQGYRRGASAFPKPVPSHTGPPPTSAPRSDLP